MFPRLLVPLLLLLLLLLVAASRAVDVPAVLARAAGLTDPYDLAEAAFALSEDGEVGAAIPLLRRAVKAAPGQMPAEAIGQLSYNLAYSLQQVAEYAEAGALFESVAASTGMGDAWVKAAQCAKDGGNPGRAAGLLERASKAFGGRNPNVFLYLGDTLNNLKRFKDAEAAYRAGLKALRASLPNGRLDAESLALAVKLHHALGDTLLNVHGHAQALEQYAAALRLAPDDAELASSAWLVGADLALWGGWEERADGVVAAAAAAVRGRGAVSPLSPYEGLFFDLPHRLRRDISESWSARLVDQARKAFGGGAAAAGPAGAGSSSPPHILLRRRADGSRPPLRLGYISRRFEDYPGTHLMLGMFARHPSARVRCFASGADDQSEERSLVASSCDAFDDVSSLTPERVADRVRAGAVDVLVDYDGLHDFNNAEFLAQRPAPVQVTFLGFAGTTGQGQRLKRVVGTVPVNASLNAVDFFAADVVTAPPELAHEMFSEGLLYLPGSYQPQDPEQPMDGGEGEGQLTTTRPRAAGPSSPTSPASWRAERVRLRSREGLPEAAPGPRTREDLVADEDAPIETGLCGAKIRIEVPAGVGEVPASLSAHSPVEQPPAQDVNDPLPVVFTCFNRWHKIDPAIYRSWMNILARSSPSSVLWLYGGGEEEDNGDAAVGEPSLRSWQRAVPLRNATSAAALPPSVCAAGVSRPSATSSFYALASTLSRLPESERRLLHLRHLHREAAAAGVHPSRVRFAARAPRARHLRRHYAADILLDTRVYGAHTTAADGLFTGLPVVTLLGSGFASRVGASLLRAAAASAPAADSTAAFSHMEYETVAAQLGGDDAAALAVRTALRAQIEDGVGRAVGRAVGGGEGERASGIPPLFDAVAYTAAFEAGMLAVAEAEGAERGRYGAVVVGA
jgi:tetratricopeptide (TPR) repeat protein